MAPLTSIAWVDNQVRILDQTKLPGEIAYNTIVTITEMYDAIKMLKVRGAPAIGVAAGFGLYLGMKDFPDSSSLADFLTLLLKNADFLASSRPTAINLFWALERVKKVVHSQKDVLSVSQLKELLLKEAIAILEEDKAMCQKIGEFGFSLLKEHKTLLTHCNAGGLATAAYGTALSPIYVGLEKGKAFKVYADETRPLLQGSRITALELMEAGVPVTLICDNMAAFVMAQGKIDAVIVGADRITANGDTANKIGTYSVALAAKEHGIPFYVAAPSSTFDTTLESGKEIPIEERGQEEIVNGFGKLTGPEKVPVYNPAFDVTPHRYITAIITEKGVLEPPFTESIATIIS